MSTAWQDLIPVLAHDARAFIRKGMTNAQLLEKLAPPAPDSAQATHLRAIIESQQGLNRLFARVVELADAENPERRAASLADSTDLRTAIIAAKLDCKEVLGKGGADFEVRDIPECRVPKRVQAVLRELIDNSARFGHPSRSLRVCIEAHVEEGSLRVRVIDTGSGIDDAYVRSLFQPLQRLDAVRSGSGLGLAIARAIIEGAGGRIYHESGESGAVFVFELPCG